MKNKSGVTLIKKANNLIESRYKFDIWESRFFLSVLAQIHKDDKDFQVYRILYKDIIKMFGLSSKQSYGFLREGASSLMKKVLYITSLENGVEVETQYHLIRTIRYLKELNEKKEEVFLENQEYIDVTVDPDMKPLLLQLRDQGGFTFYELKNVIKLTAYGLRIYELLKQYQKIGWRKLSVEEIKRTFELETEYPLFGHFYSRVIAPSIREINKHTDLQVDEPKKIKEGKKVVALLFTFRKKESSTLSEPKPTTDFKNEVEAVFETITSSAKPIQPTQQENEQAAETPSPVVEPTRPLPSQVIAPEPVKTPDPTEALYTEFEADVVKGFGVTPFVLVQLLQNYDAELIRKQIRITKRKRGTGEAINIAGFFVNAVKSDYNDPEEAKEEKKREKERQKALKKQALSEELQELIDLIIQQENNTVRKLLGNDEGLRMRAIEYATKMITNSPRLQKIIAEKEYDLETLDLMFWKQDKFLHAHFIEAIKKLEPKAFGYLKSLHERVVELDVEIKI
jgi:plasmid replication initiation protein